MAFKILSLDGGGSWAVLQAMALKDIYPGLTTKQILSQFDLVVTNSGGSLTLSAMIEHDSMDNVTGLFQSEDQRRQIFSLLKPKEKQAIEWIAGLLKVGPVYKSSRKLDGIRAALPTRGNLPLSNISQALGLNTQFLINAFDYDFQRAVYFRSDITASSGVAYEVTLAEAVHASSNAPINYFDDPARFNYQGAERRFWDGAVGGNNNPALVGVVEALSTYNQDPADIKLLSIGTHDVNLPIKTITQFPAVVPELLASKVKAKLSNDVMKMAFSILQEPMDAASYMAHTVLGGRASTGAAPRIVRLNAMVQPFLINNKWDFPPGFRKAFFIDLANMDMDAVKQDEVDKILYLGAQWIGGKVKNQAIRANRGTFACEVGYDLFAEGKAAWLAP